MNIGNIVIMGGFAGLTTRFNIPRSNSRMEMAMAENSKGVLSSIGTALHEVNVFLFDKNKKAMYLVALITIPGLTGFVFNMEAKDKADDMLGIDEIRDIIARLGNGGGGKIWNFGTTKDFVQLTEKIGESPYVRERTSSDTIITADQEKVIEKISITVTWEDETDPPQPRIRRYQNQPDVFVGTLIWPDKNNTQLVEVTEGRLTLDLSLSDEQIEAMFNQGDFILRVTCASAGDWQALFSPIDILTLPDDGNDVSISIDVTYLAPPIAEQ
jgi:hypothetical protein